MLHSVYRFPIKGLRGERLSFAKLEPGLGILGDRNFAFIYEPHFQGSRITEFVKKPSLLNQNDWPGLARLETHYSFESNTLFLSHEGKRCGGDLSDLAVRSAIEAFIFEHLKDEEPISTAKQKKGVPFRLVGQALQTRYPDRERFDVSILNLNSLRDLEKHAGSPLEIESFRGNLIVEAEPWSEAQWVGKTLTFQNTQIEVQAPIGRCQNINVHPTTAGVSQTLKVLAKYRKDANFGVIAKVLNPGELRVEI